MTKHNSEEIKILDGKATIYTNQYNVWQFRFWLQNDEKYVRKSLRTKEKIHAIVLAEKLYHKVQNEQDKGRKYYAISIFEAVKGYVTNQKQRIGKGEFCIDKSRWKTIETHMRTFLEYVAKDDKITTLNKEILREHRRLGEKSNYVSFRKNKKISSISFCR